MAGKKHPSSFALIIGGMKCGTTSLFDYLSVHPQVSPSRIKETNYFSSDAAPPSDLAPYRALWDWDAAKHRVAMEASVNYTKIPSRPNVAARLASYTDVDWRFIYLLRHPIERIESHLTHGQARAWNASEVNEHHLTCSMYARQLRAYTDYFPRKSIHLVFTDELKYNRAAALQSICEFLQIDTDFEFSNQAQMSNVANDHRADHPLITRLRRLKFSKTLTQCIPLQLRRQARKLLSRPVPRMQLDALSQKRVLERLHPDLVELRDIYSIDVESRWNLRL